MTTNQCNPHHHCQTPSHRTAFVTTMMSGRRATTFDAEIGKRIRARRETLRMSQSDIARSLGLSYQQIQKYELGKNRLPASLIPELAKVLHVDNAYFVVGLFVEPGRARRRTDDDVSAFLASDEGVMVMMTMLHAKPIIRDLLVKVAETAAEIERMTRFI